MAPRAVNIRFAAPVMQKKESGEIIKCQDCGNWHYKDQPCPSPSAPPVDNGAPFLYESKITLITKAEQSFFKSLSESVPEGFSVFPQVNLASFIDKTDNSRYRNELFRNVDFLITDSDYRPQIVIEINDQTHMSADRRERDEKVKKICEEAGIPIITLWISYGVNEEYIKNRISETLSRMPIERVHHFFPQQQPENDKPHTQPVKKEYGCYIATCIYGSYDCPQVWTLRRYRDRHLSSVWYGRLFIRLYYAISPTIVKFMGGKNYFRSFWKMWLDKKVNRLNQRGYEDTPYNDRDC